MEKRNEPLLLRPAGKDYLWGGKRLNDEYGKNIELSPLAETWECSTHPDGVSTVCCGTFDKMELTAVIKAHPEYLGERHKGETGSATLTCCWQLTRIVTVWVLLSRIRLGSMSC